jgi:hypothetical protein
MHITSLKALSIIFDKQIYTNNITNIHIHKENINQYKVSYNQNLLPLHNFDYVTIGMNKNSAISFCNHTFFYNYNITFLSRMVSGREEKNSTSPFLTWMSQKPTKRYRLTSEIDCDQTAMDLPPVPSALFLIIFLVVKCERLRGISEMLLLLRGKA